MISEELLNEVVKSQQGGVLVKEVGLERQLLTKVKLLDNFALIVTGIRRSGKSTLLLQLLRKKSKKIFFLNFEDTRLAGFENDDYRRLLRVIELSKLKVIFFDEIQMIPNWELFVRQLLDHDYKVVVTGSNATLLSKELGTKLTGRHISIELFPFSYPEFIIYKKLKANAASVEKYLALGGFPEYLKTENALILNQLLNDIVQRDIATRYGIRDVSSLRKLTTYLVSNIGKEVSANNLKEIIGIKATSTVLEYFCYLENSYIIQFLPMFSHSLKKQLRNARKVYCIDMGMFTQNSIVFTDEFGRRLENTIYLHLRIKYTELYYFKEQGECDFVVSERGKIKQVLQVCYQLTEDNRKREIAGLLAAMAFFGLSIGYLITLKQKEEYLINGCTITVLPAYEFLTENY